MLKKNWVGKCLIVLMVFVVVVALTVAPSYSEQKYKGKTLRIVLCNYEVPISKVLAPEFEERTGAKVELYEAPFGELYEKIMTALVTRSGTYDLAGPSYDWVGSYARYLLPLDDYLAKTPEIPLDDYVPNFINRGRLNERGINDPNGKLYTFPFDGDVWVLYYRKDLFEKENIPVPETWEQVIETAKHFTRDWTDSSGDGRSMYGIALMYDRVYAYIGTYFTTLLAAYKGSLDPINIFFDEDLKPVFNDEAGVKALSVMKELAAYAPPGIMTWQYAQTKDAFFDGKTAMLVSWQSVGTAADNPKESKIVGKWAVAPEMPKGKIAASADGNGRSWSIPKDSKEPDLAWEWIKYWAEYPILIKMTVSGAGMDPAREKPYRDPAVLEKFPFFAEVWEAIKVDVPFPVFPQTPKLFETLSGYLQAAITGDEEIQVALDKAAREWEDTLDDAGYYD